VPTAKGGHSDTTAQAAIQQQRNAGEYQECIQRLEEEERQLQEELALLRRQTMALSAYLEQLPTAERELLERRYRAGESFRSISLALLCDESTIRYRVQRALAMLAGWLE
jgi:RNA polymerase sigma factor (sigma-70 family)